MQRFHRIDKESLRAEREGNYRHRSREHPTSQTLPLRLPDRFSSCCHNLSAHSHPVPRKISPRSPPKFSPGGLCPHPALSAPFRIWVTVWVSPDPGGEGRRVTTGFSSITNKNQPDLERSELIFCWILPTALAGKGFEPHDLRVMRWYQKYYSEQYGRL